MSTFNQRVRIVVTRGLDAGRSTILDRGELMIGTWAGSELRLSDNTVDPAHLRLSMRSEGVHIRDLGSSRGTWAGPLRINDALLTQSTVLTLGDTTIAIELNDAKACLSADPPARASGTPEPLLVDLDALARLPYREARLRVLEKFERAYFPRVLARADHVVSRAAKHAGIARESFHRMLGRIRRNDVGFPSARVTFAPQTGVG